MEPTTQRRAARGPAVKRAQAGKEVEQGAARPQKRKRAVPPSVPKRGREDDEEAKAQEQSWRGREQNVEEGVERAAKRRRRR